MNYKIKEILPLQQGTSERGDWQSQEVIVEENANVQYPNQLLLRLRGDKTAQLTRLKVGDVVDVMYASTVRAYNTKDGRKVYNTEINCWSIRKVEQVF